MCAIIDANVRDLFFAKRCDADLKPLWDWINSGGGHTVYGGYHLKEIAKSMHARRLLLTWGRAGRASRISDSKIDAELLKIAAIGGLESNDAHVIALARASRSRLLCTHDAKLQKDFKNKTFIDKPRGKIYKKTSHQSLLPSTRTCNIK